LKNLKARISSYIEDHRQDLTNLCCNLIRAKGENPPGDVSEAADVVEDFLEGEGMTHQRLEPVEGHANILTTIGEGWPTLILCGHIDVVPAGDLSRWTFPPYSGEVRNEKIWGRGAADMKGGVAAMLMAAAALKKFEKDLSGRVVFASVSDEEAPGPGGVPWLLGDKKLEGDACLITEPSGYVGGGWAIVAGERGACWVRIIAYGRPSHGSMPMLGENAILKLTDFLPKLRALEKSAVEVPTDAKALVRSGKALLSKTARKRGISVRSLASTLDHYTANVGTMSGGTKVNIVPEKCQVDIDVRVPLGGRPEGVEELLRTMLPEDFEYQIVNRISPSYTPASDSLVKILQEHGRGVLGYKPPAICMTATSDAHRFRISLGIPTVTFGPGYIDMAHAYDEFVDVSDLLKAAKVYANAAIDYLNLRKSA